MKRIVSLFSILLVTAAFAPSLLAQQSNGERIAQLEASLAEQEQLSDAAAKDKQLARDFINDAKEAQGSKKLFSRKIKRAEFAVELVRALVAAAVIRQKAEEQEAAAFSAPETTAEMAKEVERLRKRKAVLEQKLRQIQGS